MKPEDQRIAFLEYLGWTDLNRDSKLGNYRALRGTSPEGKKDQIAPNPLKDLNIIHKAEQKLFQNSLSPINKEGLAFEWRGEIRPAWVVYQFRLNRVVKGRESGYPTHYHNWANINATPSQRLEAFLKTVNRWKE